MSKTVSARESLIDQEKKTDSIKAQENTMRIARYNMLKTLDMFKIERNELRRLRDEQNQEQVWINRFIKNEVIEMSGQMEKMQRMMQH